MGELWHSSSLGSRSSSSPLRGGGDEESPSPHFDDHAPKGADDEDDRRDQLRVMLWNGMDFPYCESKTSPIPIAFLQSAPYLCKRDGIVLHCPHSGRILRLQPPLGSGVLNAALVEYQILNICASGASLSSRSSLSWPLFFRGFSDM